MKQPLYRRGNVMRLGWITLAMVLVSAPLACDKPAARPLPPLPARHAPPAPPKAPTTRELTEGGHIMIPLKYLPIAMRVPDSWKVDAADAGGVMLKGYSPHGDIQLELRRGAVLDQHHIDLLIKGAQADAGNDPAHHIVTPIRIVNSMQEFDRIDLPASPTTVATDNGTTMVVPNFVTWEVTFFVPQGKSFLTCELSFVGLSSAQYQADHAFLRSILDSASDENGGTAVEQ